MRANEILHRVWILASGGSEQLIEVLRSRYREDGRVDHGHTPFLPVRRLDAYPDAPYAHHGICGIGVRSGQVKASHHRILAGSENSRLGKLRPLPLASKVPVKQMPFAWLRRWPNAGPPGGASPATSFLGVSRCGESHPAVYAKAIAATPRTAAMNSSGPSLKAPGDEVPGDLDDSTIPTSFRSYETETVARSTQRIPDSNSSTWHGCPGLAAHYSISFRDPLPGMCQDYVDLRFC